MADTQTVTETHQENSLLSFFVGPYYFCVPAVDVESIIIPPTIHTIPLSPNCVSGMFPHRGDIAVVISLRKKFGLDERQHITSGQLILSKISSGLKAFWVDEVLETAATEDLDWHPANEIIRCESFEQFAIKDQDVILYTTFERLYAASESELTDSLQGLSRKNKTDETDSSSPKQDITEKSSSAIPESCGDSDKDESKIQEDTAPSEETEATDSIAKGSSSKSDYNKPDPKIDHTIPSRLSSKTKLINKTGNTSNYSRSAAAPSTRRDAAAYAFKQKSLHAATRKDSSLHNRYNRPSRSQVGDTSYQVNPDKSYSATLSGPQHKQHENTDRNNFATFTALGVLLVMIALIIWWLWPEQTSNNNTLLKTNYNVRSESSNNESSQESTYQSQDFIATQDWSSEPDSAATQTTQDDPTENIDSEYSTSTNNNERIFHLETDEISITVERPVKNETSSEAVTLQTEAITEIETTETETIPAKPEPEPENLTTPYYEQFTHVVVKGDTLWHIAQRYLGNPYRYPELARLSLIKNPDLIYPGDIVRITVKKRTDR